MAKYKIQANGVTYTLSAIKIKRFIVDNPNCIILSNPFSRMPLKLHNIVVEHNKRINQNSQNPLIK